MPIHILMPALSPAMTTGTLARWQVAPGDPVRAGDVIAEIETETATMEIEAVDEGVIQAILVAEGTEGVQVGAPIAVLSAGNAWPVPAAAGRPAPGGRIIASPLARRLAREQGVDLSVLAGSGPRGRIVKRDVVRAAATRPEAAPETTDLVAAKPAAGLILARAGSGSSETVPHDSSRRALADRLADAARTVPHLRLAVDCRVDQLEAARVRLNALAPRTGARAYRLTITDILVKAMALALQQVPAANVTWHEEGLVRHRASDIGVTVAVDGGSVTPLIRHAELKSLSEISHELADLAARARSGRLAAHETAAGTTSITNLGMHGIARVEAVIEPPQSTILAVGMAERRAVVHGDTLGIATMMSCTLACDQRIVDGVTGAALLAAFKALVEEPVRMLL